MRNEYDANLSLQWADRRYDKLIPKRRSQWQSRAAAIALFIAFAGIGMMLAACGGGDPEDAEQITKFTDPPACDVRPEQCK